jgi:hypothetical protein
VVFDRRKAKRSGGIEEGLLHRRPLVLAVTADGQRAIGTVSLAIREVMVVLEATEVGHDLVERPTLQPDAAHPS